MLSRMPEGNSTARDCHHGKTPKTEALARQIVIGGNGGTTGGFGGSGFGNGGGYVVSGGSNGVNGNGGYVVGVELIITTTITFWLDLPTKRSNNWLKNNNF
uniref:Uncharacterized protein n=1 Tax=Megaselia scalaris TaxID=36166 RepID=T1GJT6_MEGSC